MEIRIEELEDRLVIGIEGDLDTQSSILLDEELEKQFNRGLKTVLIDCKKLNYISSPGIGVFTSRLDDCKRENIRLVLFDVQEKVFEVFRILGLQTLLPILKTDESVDEYLEKSA